MVISKPYAFFVQQLNILKERGMEINDDSNAISFLKQKNYYRLSAYWYPMRVYSQNENRLLDSFEEGASFENVIKLYNFDKSLRDLIMEEMGDIEIFFRSSLGHQLGKIDPLVHMNRCLLGVDKEESYYKWLSKYTNHMSRSREDFIKHHQNSYGGRDNVPIWAAVEIMDWGLLYNLYLLSPQKVRVSVARGCQLTTQQLESWLKALNILRNYSAHQARVYNMVYAFQPKYPRGDELFKDIQGNRIFGQATMIQYLHKTLGLSDAQKLPKVFKQYPENKFVPKTSLGLFDGWEEHPLWS